MARSLDGWIEDIHSTGRTWSCSCVGSRQSPAGDRAEGGPGVPLEALTLKSFKEYWFPSVLVL